jgi:hypothetical protein
MSDSNGSRGNGAHQQIDIELAGANARLTSSHPMFMQYAALHLEPMRRAANGSTPVDVDATLVWHEGTPPADRVVANPRLNEMERVDRDLYRSPNGLAWFRIDELPSLHLRFEWNGERLRVHGDFFLRLSKDPRTDWLKRSLFRRRLPHLRRRRFTTLLYYLVYYPAFWWLERKRNLHPIHAGAVELSDHVVVFAGPSGIGKSTLVAGLSGFPQGRLLSDTFLLHDGANVSAVPEPLLLDGWSRRWLGDACTRLQRLSHRYTLARDGFHWAPERRSNGGRARLLIFPHRSTSHYTRPLSPSHAQGCLSAGDLIVNDLRRYWAYASVLELLDPTPLVHARERELARLVEETPAYEIGMTPEVTRDSMRREIEVLLDSQSAPSERLGA